MEFKKLLIPLLQVSHDGPLMAPSLSATTSRLYMMLMILQLLLLLFISPIWALDAAFSADISAPTTPLLGTVYDSFGSSHGSTTLRARWRDHFLVAHEDIPFRRVRFHGILDDDLSTYYNGGPNGALVFDTLDFLVVNRIIPDH